MDRPDQDGRGPSLIGGSACTPGTRAAHADLMEFAGTLGIESPERFAEHPWMPCRTRSGCCEPAEARTANRCGADIDTVFSLGSISKSVTAVAVLDLVDAGKLSLPDRAASRSRAFKGRFWS